jgi:hypothetical protein
VALNCDTVLATIAAREAQIATLVHVSPRAETRSIEKRQVAATEPPARTDAAQLNAATSEPKQAVLQREYTTAASPSVAMPVPGAQLAQSGIDSPMTTTTHSEGSERRERAYGSSRALEWSYPMINASPAMPINSPSARLGQPSSDKLPAAPSALAAPAEATPRTLADVDSRELLHRWLDCDDSEAFALEEELTYRGFGRLSGRLVEQLFSADAADRLRLVDDVLIEPGIDARPWLVLLAEDADADVRLLVVTIMATSDDAMLLEKAWQVAIRDRDPRIAGLAGRLRERRDTVQRQ